ARCFCPFRAFFTCESLQPRCPSTATDTSSRCLGEFQTKSEMALAPLAAAPPSRRCVLASPALLCLRGAPLH
ncbi:hypothetical protein HAX54_029518, partial [Datura stramonium]|nr:hypothetical protein [Datura stramonium]